MKRLVKFAAPLLALALLGSDTAFSRGYAYAHIGTTFSWSGSAQSGWSGSTQAVSTSDFETYIQNNGACSAVAGALIGLTAATACAVNSSATTHTPILANATFSGGLISGWGTTNAGTCSGFAFSASNVTDEDGDVGLASAGSSICTSGAVLGLTQTFTTTAIPTSQTYSYWYEGTRSSAGDSTCAIGNGSASLALVIAGTTVATTNAVLDGSWHRVSGTTTAMVSGSNTFALNATLNAALGTYYIPKTGACKPIAEGQGVSVDNFVLSGIW